MKIEPFHRRVRLVIPFLALMLLPGIGAAFQPDRLAAALEAVRTRDWDAAAALAAHAGDPVAEDIVAWHALRAGRGTWDDYLRFLERNADWPGLPLMRRRAEAVMPADIDAALARAFFAQIKPQTGRGALIYSASLEGEARQAELARAWTTLVMGKEDRAAFSAVVGERVGKLNAARLDMLLWEGETEAAAELLDKVAAGDAALARARIALQKRDAGVDTLISAVPASHAGDPGLAHDRFRWRLAKGRWADAAELLKERSTSAAALGRPEAWASSRRSLAREDMREGRPRSAYRLASTHMLTEGEDYADLEWLSGFLALTYMDDPLRAVQHFDNHRKAVETPISLGRAGYWLGRAYEAAGEAGNAQTAYAFGGLFQTSFYGQLAAERIGMAPDQNVVAHDTLPDPAESGVLNASPLRAAALLDAAGDNLLSLRFLLHVEESLAPRQGAALANYALKIGQTAAAVKIAKRVVRDGDIYPDAYYPVTRLAGETSIIPPELAMAIARQESELNAEAISPAGARGLMQLMPGTAKKVSGDLGIEYDLGKLTSDPGYNGRLGTQYLADMLARYNGSVVLAAIAYNAGPARADAWIESMGDPRLPGTDVINWIEHIPYRETRNYVMRVTESLHTYRGRIAGKAGPLRLSQILRDGL